MCHLSVLHALACVLLQLQRIKALGLLKEDVLPDEVFHVLLLLAFVFLSYHSLTMNLALTLDRARVQARLPSQYLELVVWCPSWRTILQGTVLA